MVEQFNKFNDAANRMHLGVASLSEAINEGAKLGIAMGKNEIVASAIVFSYLFFLYCATASRKVMALSSIWAVSRSILERI